MNQKMKKAICMAVIGALAFTSAVGNNVTSQAAAKTKKIIMNKKKITLKVGKTFKLKVKKVKPAKASKAVTYKSNKKNIATVSKKGKITAKKVGTAKITVTSKKNKKAKTTVKVTVKKAATKKVTPTTAPSNSPAVSGTPAPTTAATNAVNPSDAPDSTVTPDTDTPAIDKPNSTLKPTKSPKPTATPIPPRYTEPATTAEPNIDYDLTNSKNYKNENESSAELTVNDDKSLTIKFIRQYGAVNFYLPDNAENYFSSYKSVTITYTSEGGDLGYALYDGSLDYSGPEPSGTETGKHPNWNHPVVESKGKDTTLIATVNDIPLYEQGGVCEGNCLRGIQIFCPDDVSEDEPIIITIKSIKFSTELSGNPGGPGVDTGNVDTGNVDTGNVETGNVDTGNVETGSTESSKPSVTIVPGEDLVLPIPESRSEKTVNGVTWNDAIQIELTKYGLPENYLDLYEAVEATYSIESDGISTAVKLDTDLADPNQFDSIQPNRFAAGSPSEKAKDNTVSVSLENAPEGAKKLKLNITILGDAYTGKITLKQVKMIAKK